MSQITVKLLLAVLSLGIFSVFSPVYAWLNIHSSYGIAGTVSVYENSNYIQSTNSASFQDQSVSSALAFGVEYEDYFNKEWGFSAGINYSERRSFTKIIQGYANIIYHVDPRFYVFGGMNYSKGSNINMSFTSGSNSANVLIDTQLGLGYQVGMGYQLTDVMNVELLYEQVSLHAKSSITHSSIPNFDYRADQFDQSSVKLALKYSFFDLFNF